jgi:hypothetical protein
MTLCFIICIAHADTAFRCPVVVADSHDVNVARRLELCCWDGPRE